MVKCFLVGPRPIAPKFGERPRNAGIAENRVYPAAIARLLVLLGPNLGNPPACVFSTVSTLHFMTAELEVHLEGLDCVGFEPEAVDALTEITVTCRLICAR